MDNKIKEVGLTFIKAENPVHHFSFDRERMQVVNVKFSCFELKNVDFRKYLRETEKYNK